MWFMSRAEVHLGGEPELHMRLSFLIKYLW